ncbi:MAG: O-antigen ligase family protein [Acidobacteria bacterium]|nr:O-antigen ligase family protein [Acidobacteriota bacterium]
MSGPERSRERNEERPSTGNRERWRLFAWTCLALLLLREMLVKGLTPVGTLSTLLLTGGIVLGSLGGGPRDRRPALRRFAASPAFLAPAIYLVWLAADFGLHGFRTHDPATQATRVLQVLLFWSLSWLLSASHGRPGGDPPRPAPRRPFTAVETGLLPLVAGFGTLEALVGIVQYAVTGERVGGTLGNPNQYAALVAAALAVCLGLLASRDGGPRVHPGWPAAATVPLLTALWLSGSRGALAGLAAGALLFGSLILFRRRWPLVAVVLLLPLLAGAVHTAWMAVRFETVYQRHYAGLCGVLWVQHALTGNYEKQYGGILRYYDFDGSGRLDARDIVLAARQWKEGAPPEVLDLDRVAYAGKARRLLNVLTCPDLTGATRFWALGASLRMMRDHPLTGVGPGNWIVSVPDYLVAYDEALLTTHAHSLPLQLGVELGLPGLLLWLALIMAVVAATRRQLGERGGGPVRGPRASAAGWGLSAGAVAGFALLVTAGHNLLDVTVFTRPLRFVLPALLALLFAPRNRERSEKYTGRAEETGFGAGIGHAGSAVERVEGDGKPNRPDRSDPTDPSDPTAPPGLPDSLNPPGQKVGKAGA